MSIIIIIQSVFSSSCNNKKLYSILLFIEVGTSNTFKENPKDFKQIWRGARHCDYYPDCEISAFTIDCAVKEMFKMLWSVLL